MKHESTNNHQIGRSPSGPFASTLECEGPALHPFKLGKGVYVLRANTRLKANTGVVVGESGVLIVDAGIDPAMRHQIKHVVDRLTDKPIRYLVKTTWQGEKAFGNDGYPHNVTVISPDTRKISRRSRDCDQTEHWSNTGDNVRAIRDAVDPRRPRVVSNLYREFGLGGQLVQVWKFGPGLAASDTVIYVPREKIAWTGNYLPAPGIPPLLIEGGPDPYIASLRRMRCTLDIDTIVPGYGPIASAAPALENLIEYLREVREKVRASIAMRRSLEATLAAYPMSDRLVLPGGVTPTQSVQSLIANLHRINVLVTYRIFETDAAGRPTG